MRKIFKYLAWFLVGLAALVLIALAVLLNIDFNNYKSVIEQRTEAATGRSLKIGGRLDVDLGLTTSVAVSDVRFGNAPGGSRDTMLELGRLEVEVDLFSLLTSTPYVRRLLLKDVDLLVENDASGRSNLELVPAAATSGTGAADAPAAAPEQEKAGGLLLPILREADISNIRIRYKASPKAPEKLLEITSLAIQGGESASDPVELTLTGKADGAPLGLQGQTGSWNALKSRSQPWPVSLNGDLAGLKLAVAGSIANPLQGQGLDITVNAETAEVGGLSRLTLPLTGAAVPALGPLKVALALRGDAGRNLLVQDINLELGNGTPLMLSVTGAAALEKGLPAPDLKIAFRTPDLSGLSKVAGAPLPALRPVALAAHVTGDGQGGINADQINLTLGRNSLTGTASVKAGARPSVGLALAGDTFLLDDLLDALGNGKSGSEGGGGGASGSGTAAAGGQDRLIPATPLDLSALRMADAHFSLALAKLQLARGFFAPVRISASLKDGVLTLPEFSMTDNGGGVLTARLELDARSANTGVKTAINANRMATANLLQLAGQPGLIDGPVALDAELAANGGSLRALAAALNGHIRLDVTNGQLNVEEIRRLAGSAATTGMAALFGNAKEGQTPLYCMVADYKVEKGLATVRTLVLDAGSSTVTGKGTVDLGTEKLDMTIVPHGLLGGAVSVVVRGSLSAPEVGAGKISLNKLLPGLGGEKDAVADIGDLALVAANSPCVNLRPGSKRQTAAENAAGKAVDKAVEKGGKAVGDLLKKAIGQ